MTTKQIKLFYRITQNGIEPPAAAALHRKDAWLAGLQKLVRPNSWQVVELTYRLINPDVERQRKFFNGPVVDYYAIQHGDITTGEIPESLRDQYRETILSDCLGFDVELIGGKKERRRKSTSDFKTTQKWHDFLETLRETLFDSHGYEFPDSEAFWGHSKAHGYDQARRIAKEQLQARHLHRLSTEMTNGKGENGV